MKVLDSYDFNKTETTNPNALTTPQIRVLKVLYESRGVLRKNQIAERIGAIAAIVTGWAIGYANPVKREAFKLTKDGQRTGVCLLDRGYVEKVSVNVDGLKENGYSITEKGIKAYEALGEVKLGPLKDSWAVIKGRTQTLDDTED